MKKRRINPLNLLFRCRWARMGLCVVFSAIVAIGAHAQTQNDGESGILPPRDRNSELRTSTWSIYAQGGLSWATSVWYQELDAKRVYTLSPAVGCGVDFTIRPWVRVGVEYLWSNHCLEQRFFALDAMTMPLKTYGNYKMNYHNAKLGAGFNMMELWPQRRAQWLNIWAGTGFGYSFGSGNEYGMFFSNTQTQNGVTTPLTDGSIVLDDSEITITGNVRTTNRHEVFNTPFVPASLHVEADLNRRFTVGLKGEVDWLLNRQNIAPKCLIYAMATLRYNFVQSSTRVQRNYYEGVKKALREELEAAKAKAESEKQKRLQMEEQNGILLQQLSDCEKNRESEASVEQQPLSHFVQFEHNSSFLSPSERDRLKEFALNVTGLKLSILAEASTPGTEEYNQMLSEKRLERVVKALIEEGFTEENLHPQIAIGEKNGKPAAEGRRVTITVE